MYRNMGTINTVVDQQASAEQACHLRFLSWGNSCVIFPVVEQKRGGGCSLRSCFRLVVGASSSSPAGSWGGV